MQNLVTSAGAVRRMRSTRNHLLALASYGLNLPLPELDALAWLLDGERITTEETKRFVGRDSSAAIHQDDGQLWDIIVEMLGRALKRRGGANTAANVRIEFSTDASARLEELQTFLEYERQPGQRLFASSLPSSLVNPDRAFEKDDLVPPYVRNTDLSRMFLSLFKERRETFLVNLHTYGERSIHSKLTLERYLTTAQGNFLSIPQRRAHIENWIALLEQHQFYEVGLTDDEPLLELGIKTTPIALIRGSSSDRGQRHSPWGVHHILFRDEHSVFSFIHSFATAWRRISEEGRDKASVVRYLRRLLESSA